MIPNKTAPCLLKELLDFDPRVNASDATLHKGNRCTHAYTVVDRSNLPAHDDQSKIGAVWTLLSICQQCRCHLEMTISFPEATSPCPTHEYPLHHFLNRPGSISEDGMPSNFTHFTCSNLLCQARLAIRVDKPVMSPRDIEALTNQHFLKRRHHHSLTFRENSEEISAFKALATFRSYVANAVDSGEQRRIPTANKFFMLALGSDSGPLLEELGFAYEKGDSSTESYWVTPKVILSENPGSGEIPATVLRDVVDELNVLMALRPASERVLGRVISFVGADREMKRLMGIPEDELSHNRTVQETPEYLRSYYDQLGALYDFSDSLIEFAYDRQVAVDQAGVPAYFQALKEIAASRQSESLLLKASKLESEGQVSQQAIQQAYRFFSIDPQHSHVIKDAHIAGAYQARIADVSAEGKADARRALSILGKARQSQMLLATASDEVNSYEDALRFLGADETTADEWFGPLATTKAKEDNPATVQKALDIISTHRNNPAIRFAHSGSDQALSTMDLSMAYVMVGCDEADSDQDVADKASIRFADNDVERKKEIREAFEVIARARNQKFLIDYLEEHLVITEAKIPETPLTEPRGLDNIGQTCYLNSLLQYFFTIKDIRSMILEYPNRRQAADPSIPFQRTLGGLPLKASEIHRAQHFVQELQSLFKQLISTSEVSIRPRDQLAGLTLMLEPKAQESSMSAGALTRRRSTLPESPTLARIMPRPSASSVTSQSHIFPDAHGQTGPLTEEPGAEIRPSDQIKELQPQEADMVDSPAEMSALPGEALAEFPPLPPRPIRQDELAKFAQQNDVSEVMESVLYQLRFAFAPEGRTEDGEQVDAISKLFFGKQDLGRFVKGRRERNVSPFYILFLSLEQERNDIYTGIDYFNRPEDYSEDNFRYMVIDALPPILQFYIQRLTQEKDGQLVKNNNFLELDRIIYMDRYLPDDEMFERRRQVWGWRKELDSLKPQLDSLSKTDMGMQVPAALELTAQFLQTRTALENQHGNETINPFDDNDQLALLELANSTKQAMEDMQARVSELEINIANAFDKTKGKYAYELHSVFVHRGSAQSGHWFIYIYDAQSDTWRQYNDETVTIVTDTREFLRPDEHGRETSAVVSYVQKDRVTELIETVKRDLPPAVAESSTAPLDELTQ